MALPEMHKLIDEVIKVLFAADDRRLQAWIDRLCEKNQEARREPCIGFLYGGRYFKPSNVTGLVKVKRSIDPSLYPQIDQLLADEKLIDKDKAFIRQGMFAVLDPCRDVQEIRDALPECLVDCLPNLKTLSRHNEPGFTVQDNPRALRQFNKILPMMEVYATARMVF
jgi:hypothetical protein